VDEVQQQMAVTIVSSTAVLASRGGGGTLLVPSDYSWQQRNSGDESRLQ
jgi:hypothetical protein